MVVTDVAASVDAFVVIVVVAVVSIAVVVSAVMLVAQYTSEFQ